MDPKSNGELEAVVRARALDGRRRLFEQAAEGRGLQEWPSIAVLTGMAALLAWLAWRVGAGAAGPLVLPFVYLGLTSFLFALLLIMQQSLSKRITALALLLKETGVLEGLDRGGHGSTALGASDDA